LVDGGKPSDRVAGASQMITVVSIVLDFRAVKNSPTSRNFLVFSDISSRGASIPCDRLVEFSSDAATPGIVTEPKIDAA
jgi:hypothetical protein